MTLKEYLSKQFTAFASAVKTWATGLFVDKTSYAQDKATFLTSASLENYVQDSELANYFNAAPKYNSESKKIEFYHDTNKVAELDATAFIKDGMVNTVTIADGKTDGPNNGKKVLKITFNTDSGKEDIEVALDGIFDASNYYTKTQADEKFAEAATTLAGYGITDAKIADGVITLGTQTIKPVVESDFVDITASEFQAMFA